MKIISKASLLAISALGMMVGPVHAASIASPANGAAVTATGTVDISIVGWAGRRICDVTLSGTIDSSGLVDKFVFTSGSSTNCNAEDQGVVEFPFSVTATSPTAVTIDAVTLNSGGGFWPCTFTNVALDWSNATSTASLPSGIINNVCFVHAASITISPAVNVIL